MCSYSWRIQQWWWCCWALRAQRKTMATLMLCKPYIWYHSIMHYIDHVFRDYLPAHIPKCLICIPVEFHWRNVYVFCFLHHFHIYFIALHTQFSFYHCFMWLLCSFLLWPILIMSSTLLFSYNVAHPFVSSYEYNENYCNFHQWTAHT